ncbi:MAG: hypothetical protein HQK53_09415 [Oligoflexia bacterium]|nr:hypothetical protein [Oligoflexia bacterium]
MTKFLSKFFICFLLLSQIGAFANAQCFYTKVVRTMSGSDIYVNNNCNYDMSLYDLDIFWGQNISSRDYGIQNVSMNSTRMTVPANGRDTYVYSVSKQSRFTFRWDFKYRFVIQPVDGDEASYCQHWANEPGVINKYCDYR